MTLEEYKKYLEQLSQSVAPGVPLPSSVSPQLAAALREEEGLRWGGLSAPPPEVIVPPPPPKCCGYWYARLDVTWSGIEPWVSAKLRGPQGCKSVNPDAYIYGGEPRSAQGKTRTIRIVWPQVELPERDEEYTARVWVTITNPRDGSREERPFTANFRIKCNKVIEVPFATSWAGPAGGSPPELPKKKQAAPSPSAKKRAMQPAGLIARGGPDELMAGMGAPSGMGPLEQSGHFLSESSAERSRLVPEPLMDDESLAGTPGHSALMHLESRTADTAPPWTQLDLRVEGQSIDASEAIERSDVRGWTAVPPKYNGKTRFYEGPRSL